MTDYNDLREDYPMTLPTCPREDCAVPVVHWHADSGWLVRACLDALNGHECDHDPTGAERCYAPRVPAPAARPEPVALPTAEEVARTTFNARAFRYGWTSTWEDQPLGIRRDRIAEAQAALDLITTKWCSCEGYESPETGGES